MGCMKQLHEHLERVSYKNLGVVMLESRKALAEVQGHIPLTPRLGLISMLEYLSNGRHPNRQDVIDAFTWDRTPFSFWRAIHEGRPVRVEDFQQAARAVRALIEAMEEEDEHD